MTIFWLRRDLRLDDNRGLFMALKENSSVLPIFIFDKNILKDLDSKDARVQFIHQQLVILKEKLAMIGSDLKVFHATPLEAFKEIFLKTKISAVYCNRDYEPSAKFRDLEVQNFVESQGSQFKSFKDQVVFEANEIQKEAGGFYSMFTPYKNKWLTSLRSQELKSSEINNFEKNFLRVKEKSVMPKLKDLGFQSFDFKYYPALSVDKKKLENYDKDRDFPAQDATSHLGLHLRFGTISPRYLVGIAKNINQTWLSELIWREFFMQILDQNPQVVKKSFREEFEKVEWRNDKTEFKLWCEGQTGYPLVDAGMRELNATGYMHNRARMVTGSFLTKHLLMHWYLGERYFAKKLLDFDLAANNGNWQWVAGTGCDAAPYFRIFNPEIQQKKFDKNFEYIKKWVPEFGTAKYTGPIVGHSEGRDRALRAFAKVSKEKKS